MPDPRFCPPALPLAVLLSAIACTANAQGVRPLATPNAAAAEVTQIEADRIEGVSQETLHAEGNVVLIQGDKRLRADQINYRMLDEEVEASGNVVITAPGAELSGPRLQFRMGEYTGFMESPAYRFNAAQANKKAGTTRVAATSKPRAGADPKALEARGEAERIEIESENHYRMEGATYSTCKAGDDSWFAQFSELSFDYDRDEGEGWGAKVVFKGVPILYAPYLDFPLSSGRRSGFLSPTIGSTSTSGFEFQLPYYWNIAPNLDATLTPHYYSDRGTQLGVDQRYLFASASGEIHGDYLGSDRITGTDRSGYRWRHQQRFPFGISGSLDVGKVSDDTYFKDFATQIVSSSQTLVARTGSLNWAYEGWATGVRVLNYQVLQPDPLVAPSEPYAMEPQVTVAGRSLLSEMVEGALNFDYTHFRHSDARKIQGERSVVYPKLSFPMVWPGYYLTPRVGVHYTNYQFESPVAGIGDRYSRSVPISSLDTGLVFEREAHAFGRRQLQTLEPRLFYLNVPYRDQSALTNAGVNFDTGVMDFNFSQIFAENLFAGQDRIAEAEQLTAAVTTRILDESSGKEYLRATLGQRYYFKPQRVTLNAADSPRTEKKDDLLAEIVSGELFPKTYLNAGVQYNTRDNKVERFNIAGRYQPTTGNVINAAYRYSLQQVAPFGVDIKSVDLSGQWNLAPGWRAVGRFNYSLKDNREIEDLLGIEYYSGCWATRFVVHRFATTTNEFTEAFFVQLELKGFGEFGVNPFAALSRSVPGYSREFPTSGMSPAGTP